MQYMVIGSGVAGATAAETLRRLDPQSRIRMIGDESGPPYCRPMISLLLGGSISERALPIKSEDFFEEHRIDAVLTSRVSRLDSRSKQIVARDGREFAYDRLLIASGADPRPVKADNRGLKNIFFMRTRSQVKDMLAALPEAKKALVTGGGLVGFKAAYGLLRRGLDVTMLIRSQHPLSMQVDAAAGRMIRDVLEEHGLSVRVGAPDERAGDRHRRGGHDDRGLPVHHALARQGGGLLPH
ncbi:MAG: FAD-dependent oxidoreductase [Desulfosalsimonadaceae bacterium]